MTPGETWTVERRALQGLVAVLACIPIATGLAGALFGIAAYGHPISHAVDLDSHGRYLSGLLLAIGLGFWSAIPAIEAQGPRIRLLTAIVIIGGLARLGGAIAVGLPSSGMIGGLVMELVVTPALAIWRESLDRRSPTPATPR